MSTSNRIRVKMIPNALNLVSGESGIHTLVRAWTKHLPAVGIDLVDQKTSSFDVLAIHAGMTREYPTAAPLCAHLHGLYWTADYKADRWEYRANRDVIDSVRHATTVTVPSAWVAETLHRDMHLSPEIVGHGIDWDDWQHKEPNEGYVLWNKNRVGDVCSPAPVGELAIRFPHQRFLTTFAPDRPMPNIKATGVVPHIQMRKMVQRAAVYLATTKETWGIGIVEAMAAGTPVLGFRQGGILDTVEHGVSGYLARPGDYDDLARGLAYCLKHRDVLGANARAAARQFTWRRVAEQLAGIYTETIERFNQPALTTVVIPCYNYAEQLPRAVESAAAQAAAVIIVDNNSTDDTATVARRLAEQFPNVRYVNEPAQGVAHARNRGIREATTKYVACLDADDMIEPGFVETCVKALEADRSLGIAYTRLRWVKADGSTGLSDWPGEYNYDAFLKRRNQVPTCSVFRREMWQRLGGYRQRFAPAGAGAEDAEFFLRAGALGWGAKLATQQALFVYSWGTGQVSGNRAYQEADWLAGKPWVEDKLHPFASLATPANQSHPVRQYDAPVISVVIPCGPNHKGYLVDALDSLEAQTYRRWEAIVTTDGWTAGDELRQAFPFVRWVTGEGKGAGHARNLGVSHARAGLLLFLDADDWLRPTALAKLLMAWNRTKSIAYSDYAGHAHIEGESDIAQLKVAGRLESYDERTHAAVVIHRAYDYDCAEALRQPRIYRNGEFYIWNLITSLTPQAWHDEIGGFDEAMPSWEDWDYWLRMARAGKCFTRIAEPLVDYRFYSGTRRETGRQNHESLLHYMSSKYKETDPMPCSGCGGRAPVHVGPGPTMAAAQSQGIQMNANDIVWVQLADGNEGQHPIIGHATRTNYGYRAHGDLFKMAMADVTIARHKFVIVEDPEAVLDVAASAMPITEADQTPELDEPELKFADWAELEGDEPAAEAEPEPEPEPAPKPAKTPAKPKAAASKEK